jgi:copper chaperone CopZ
MSLLVVIAVLVLVNWWAFRARARSRARRQATLTFGARPRRGGPPTLSRAPAPAASASAGPAAEPIARAFAVYGLPPGPAAPVALTGLLRRLAGVASAYVSPVTALAYLAYWPAQVSEDELVQAIQGAGYAVGAAAQRFDWRHRRAAPVAAVAPLR